MLYVVFLYLFTITTSPTGTHGSKIKSRFQAAKKNSYKKDALLYNDKTTTPINNRSLVMSGWWCPVAKQYFRTLSNNSDFSIYLCSVRLYLLFFVGGFVSYLRNMYLFTYSGVKHILCCAFVLFVFVLCVLCCGFLLIFHLYSLFGIL